jgi:hypothetical protein
MYNKPNRPGFIPTRLNRKRCKPINRRRRLPVSYRRTHSPASLAQVHFNSSRMMLVRLLPIKEQPNFYLTTLYRRRLAQSLRQVSNPIGQILLQGLHRLVRLCPASLYSGQCNRTRLPVSLSLSRYHHNLSPIHCRPKRQLLRQYYLRRPCSPRLLQCHQQV